MTTPTTTETSPLLSNRLYDILKWLTTLFFPALGTFYFTIAEIFNLPMGGQVAAACTAVSLFLGTLIKLSDPSFQQAVRAVEASRYVGDILVATDPDGHKSATLDFGEHPYDIDKHPEVVLKVKKVEE